MVVDFTNLFASFQGSGLFEFFLPFLLVFSVVFAVLQKVKVLGDNKGVQVIVSLVIGLLAAQNSFVVFLINNFLSNIALIIVLIIVFLIILGLLAGDEVKANLNWVILVVALLGIFWALFYDLFAGTWILPELFQLTGGSQGSLLTILIFIVVIFVVVGGFGKGQDNKPKQPLFQLKGSG